MKRLSKVNIVWSPNLAYAIGLIASDGNLSKDGRHITLTSKDLEMIKNFKRCLNLSNKIGRKARGGSTDKKYFVVQFGDRNFYEFLLSIGLTPSKSKTLGPLKIVDEFFKDFLRGLLDGDGNINIFKHPESKHPQLRVRFFSASSKFIKWIQSKTLEFLNISGFAGQMRGAIELEYAKLDSTKLLNFIYYKNCSPYLSRKYIKAVQFLNK